MQDTKGPSTWSGPRPRHLTPYSLAQLRELLPLGVVPDADDVSVTGITHDSRQVRPGDLYAALPGNVTHGARFVVPALEAGAAAVLTDEEGARLAGARGREGVVDGPTGAVPMLVVDHPRAWLGEVSAAIYGHPARDLLMLGVTGTNGKTTTAYLLEAGLRHAGTTTGLIGTVETRVNDDVLRSVRTTPEATDVHALLAVMRERGVRACAMEVSSHALAYGRVDAVSFDVVGFTNLSQDHLDFHTDLAEYFNIKARLFTPRYAKRAVVCVDDEPGQRLATQAGIPAVTVATVPGTGYADWGVQAAEPLVSGEAGDVPAEPLVSGEAGPDGYHLVGTGGLTVPLRVPLPGAFNVANAALAVVMLAEAGVDLDIAAAGVGECEGVPGRMEWVHGAAGTPMAVVDYAHTPDAIQNVLRALRHGRGRLVAVVGAGGDRDRDKRSLMGAAAARYADVVVVTDDNPRSEDPAVIRAAVLAGMVTVQRDEPAEVIEVAGRREAFRAALGRARGSTDTVVVLGKGHEQGQEIAGTVHPFDDRDVLREELSIWGSRGDE